MSVQQSTVITVYQLRVLFCFLLPKQCSYFCTKTDGTATIFPTPNATVSARFEPTCTRLGPLKDALQSYSTAAKTKNTLFFQMRSFVAVFFLQAVGLAILVSLPGTLFIAFDRVY